MSNALNVRRQTAPVLKSISILLYGFPKTGKTTEAAKFPEPLLLNCEPGGTDLLKGEHDVIDVISLQQLDAMTGALAAAKYRAIVLDGFTWMINQAARDKIKEIGEKNRLRAYAQITEQVQRVLGDLLRSGKIVVATGHSRVVDDEEIAEKVEVRPDINPRLSDGVFGLFSIIAYCYPTADGSMMLTKPQDNEKRRILAGDRTGILPRTMRLSAGELMKTLKATQPQAEKPPTTQPDAGQPAETAA